MSLARLLRRPRPFETGRTWPWDNPDFSRRALVEQLDPTHDRGCRRPEVVRRHVAFLIEAAALRPGARVLDLACGPGLYAHELGRRGVASVGVDISPAAIDYAREAAVAEALPCEFVRADMRTFEADRPFDATFLLYAEINAMPPAEAAALLARVAALTRPGGTVVVEITAPGFVERKGREPMRWSVARRGLWCDGPHIQCRRRFTYLDANVTGLRYVVFERRRWRTACYDAFIQHYAPDAFAAMLTAAGLPPVAQYGDLAGAPCGEDDEWRTWLCRRARR